LTSESLDRPSPNILVLATKFPSPIQPWLVNQLAQIERHGGEVTIVASRPEGETVPARVRELGLLGRTHYERASSAGDILGRVASLALPFSARGRRGRIGLRRLLDDRWRPDDLRGGVKGIARAGVLGLEYDLVHAHSLVLAYELRHAATVRRVPFVLTFHGQTPTGVPTLPPEKRARLFGDVDVALVNTNFAARQLESLGCPRDRVEILPQGIFLSDYPFRSRPRPDDGPVELLTVGRIQADKGLTYAIDAVTLLRQRGYDIRYTIVGGGPQEEELRRRVADSNLGDVVSLTGRVDDGVLRGLYRRSHIFVLPSVTNPLEDHTETQGVVLQEAQASGLIVAASRVGGIPECVEEGVSAFLFPDRDPEGIASVIASIIARPEMWRAWQERGRAWVEARFDADLIGDELWRLYGGLLAGHRAATGILPTGRVG